MRLDDDARKFLYADLTITVDPTGSTVLMKVDGADHPMAWQNDPVPTGAVWTQTARTVEKFCGSAVVPGVDDVLLTPGQHLGQVIVFTTDGQALPAKEFPIDAR